MITQTTYWKNHAILDHGYLKYIEGWGSDEAIVEAARMSTGKGFQGWGPIHHKDCLAKWNYLTDRPKTECTCGGGKPGDEKLLSYLYKHKHMTPFEMAGLVIEVKAPIFVFREWQRHRSESFNELSARYTPLPDENYIPGLERIIQGAAPTGNRQASGTSALTDQNAVSAWLVKLEGVYAKAQAVYEEGLELGIPKELARLPVPVARYSRMRASANLRNWLAFLTLRMDKTAQWEIRMYANALGSIIKERFPRTWALFDEGRIA